MEHASSDFGRHFCHNISIDTFTTLSLAYCTEGTFAIQFATEAIYYIAHKATESAQETAVFTQRQRF